MKNFKIFAAMLTILAAMLSLYFMFRAGSSQKSIVLISLFTAWVLSPFAGLLLIQKINSQWNKMTISTDSCLMIGISILSIFVYSGAFTIPNTRPAMPYLVFPLLSWIFIGVSLLIFRKSSGN